MFTCYIIQTEKRKYNHKKKNFFIEFRKNVKKSGNVNMEKQNQWYHGMIMYGIALAAVVCACIFQGCGLEETDTKKLKDLSYEILEEKEIPEEFLTVIEEKKETIFKLTYTDKEYLYIAAGYGVQETGGYSIAVNDCYLTKNAVYFDTTLIGPSKGEKINQVKSYPYLVIRTKYLEKNVVFE